MKLGRITVDPVIDGRILSILRPSKPFPPGDSPLWADQGGMVQPDGLVASTLGAFLVRTGDRVVLVDAGAGQAFPDGSYSPVIDLDDPDDPVAASMARYGLPPEDVERIVAEIGRSNIQQGDLPRSLDALGVRPDDVTDVILTHLHFDHIGWLSADGRPFFRNATVRCAAADLEHFLAGPDEEVYVARLFGAPTTRTRLEPVLHRIETWENDQPVAPGIDVRLAAGHTPGSSVIVLSDGQARALLLGDVIHCPLELMDDDFNLLVDHDQQLADEVRVAYARELEGADVVASAAHFPGLQFGRLLPSVSGRRWTFN